jgi:hypothetical protein
MLIIKTTSTTGTYSLSRPRIVRTFGRKKQKYCKKIIKNRQRNTRRMKRRNLPAGQRVQDVACVMEKLPLSQGEHKSPGLNKKKKKRRKKNRKSKEEKETEKK